MEEIWGTIQKGIFHIINFETYDHLIYVVIITVPFLFNKWKRILGLITIFILGHIITLALDTFDVVRADKQMVMFLMYSILFILAVYNVISSGKRPAGERYGVVFFLSLGLGLAHGFITNSFFSNLFKSGENKVIYLLETTLGMWLGLLILAFLSVLIGFICQTVFRFKNRDWVLVTSSIIIGVLIPLIISTWIF
ncbi:HupE / UreJ protein [Flavobacteriaceae bacterium MAR_2010_188]|nr:HupE / UreJ protein [Flavobacteriaceae bacterium MAR_2010_188]